MNISYDAYRTFYYAAKCRSFTQAARALQNSQPNITRTIKNLEQVLGCTLFLRNNRRVELTREGEILYRHVSAAFEQFQAGEEAISRGSGLEGGILRIAATEVAMRIFLLPVLSQFRSLYPGVHIKLISGSTPDAVETLENGLADLAVVTTPVDLTENLKKTPLMQIQEVAICGRAYQTWSQSVHSLSDLEDVPTISLSEKSGTYRFYTKIFTDHNLIFEPDIEAATADQVLPMVKANLGIGFVPEAFLQPEDIGTNVFPIALSEVIPKRSIFMLTSRKHRQGAAALELERALIQAGDNVLHDSQTDHVAYWRTKPGR